MEIKKLQESRHAFYHRHRNETAKIKNKKNRKKIVKVLEKLLSSSSSAPRKCT
jgi:hypothetical protein